MTIVIALVIGIAAGILGGAFGIGGGILIVPALIAFLGFSQLRAQGTSLVALLAPVGLTAIITYYQKRQIDFQVGALVAAGFLVGGFLGSKLALGVGEDAIRKGFALFLVAVGLYMWFRR
jgi:uncharacterized membrane protein YfcA